MIRPRKQPNLSIKELELSAMAVRRLEGKRAIPTHTEIAFLKFLKTDRGQELARMHLIANREKGMKKV